MTLSGVESPAGLSEGLPEFPEYGFSEVVFLNRVGGPSRWEEGLKSQRSVRAGSLIGWGRSL